MLAFCKLKLLIICTLFITLTYGGGTPEANKSATTAATAQKGENSAFHSTNKETKVVATESGNISVPVLNPLRLNTTVSDQQTNVRQTDHTSREHVSNQKSNYQTLIEKTKESTPGTLSGNKPHSSTKTVLEDLVTSLPNKSEQVHESIHARKEAKYAGIDHSSSSIPPPIVNFNISNAGDKNTTSANATSPSNSIPITNTTSTTTTPSSTTTKPKKPTVTIGSEDDPLDNLSSKDKNQSTLKPNDKMMDPTRRTNTNYIVPIVAVILSVPLVAIVASVLYKRGSEWWQHRHYRRMDFLIDGIYNN